MTISKITRSGLTGQSPTEHVWFKEAKARVWHAGLRLWMWRYQPHLRVRPKWDTKVVNEIEHVDSADVRYKHVYAVAVWDITGTKIVYWNLHTYKCGWFGRITTLRYLEECK